MFIRFQSHCNHASYKRSHDNVDDDDEGEGEDNVKMIQIVSQTTEKNALVLFLTVFEIMHPHLESRERE